MDKNKRERLEKAGFRIGDYDEFLGLSPVEKEYIEMRITLSKGIREARRRQELTQKELASIIGSSQSRIAKMEAADASVSLDLQFKSYFAMGFTREDLCLLIKEDMTPA
jgi:DNA-binding XRE family transcriptional regulator